MTEPTNKELDAVITHYRTRIYPQDMQPHFERAIMRAVLAKWGTPASVGVEPVAWAFKYDDGTWHDPSTTEHSSGMRPLFAAPQPVEREPLTDEQIKDLQDDGVFLGTCRQIVRAIEAAHGIKGGQPCA